MAEHEGHVDGGVGDGTAAVAGAAALAACHLRQERDELAVLFEDLTTPGGPRHCSPTALSLAAVELSALALARVAAQEGRAPEDVVAGIADGYASIIGRDAPTALTCYAAAMSAGRRPDLVADVLGRCTTLHGEAATAIAAAFVLAAAWRFQGRDEGCAPEQIAQRVAVAGAC
jgi:hypothetical protein